MIGFGFGFILAEWRQVHEISGQKVKPGHPFAIRSGHFKQSTIIGIVLVGTLSSIVISL